MIEFFRHVTGACGESHPNIFHLILSGTGITISLKYIWFYIKQYLFIIKNNEQKESV
jgi:hypothetical protein